MTQTLLAQIYAALIVLPMSMQIALALGAPLGRFTVGGRFSGRLPAIWRVLALVQAGLLALMAGSVLAHAGLWGAGLPDWAIWPALTMTVLTFLANAVSPSLPERRLWTPVIGAMLICILGVIFL